MFKEILEKLLSRPQKGQIAVGLDVKKKVFRLSVPIFSSKKLPDRVREYALTRKNLTFKPHATSYEIEGEKVFLIQEIPFSLDFQSTSKKEVNQFLALSRHCHKMLSEIVAEDACKIWKNSI